LFLICLIIQVNMLKGVILPCVLSLCLVLLGQCCLTISHCFWLKAVASHHSAYVDGVMVNLLVLFVLFVCK